MLASLGDIHLPLFVMGDVNIQSTSESAARRFHDLLLSYNSINAITLTSRVTTTTATSLDICVTNVNSNIMDGSGLRACSENVRGDGGWLCRSRHACKYRRRRFVIWTRVGQFRDVGGCYPSQWCHKDSHTWGVLVVPWSGEKRILQVGQTA